MSAVAVLAGVAAAASVGLAVGGPRRARRGPARRARDGGRPDAPGAGPGGFPSGRFPGRTPPPPGPVLLAVGAAPLVVVAASVGPTATVLVAAVAAAGRVVQVRAVRRARRRAVDSAVPDLVDLFVLAASAGHPVPLCVERVAARAPTAVRPAVAAARDHAAAGRSVAEALEPLRAELGDLGPHLVDALVAGLRTGAPVVPTLEAVAAAARDRRRRTAEEQARRLPVTLLFPLVGCVLPAFGLLAVVPLLVASLGSLSV